MRHISRYIALFVLFAGLIFGFAEKSQGSAQIAPQTVTITGGVSVGSVGQGDGGGLANSWAVTPNDGTNVVGTLTHPVVVGGPGTAGTASTMVGTVQGIAGGTAVNIDPVPASETNTLVTQNVPAVQQVLIDAGTRCITDINYTNESLTVGGYAQIFCGQYVTDAGGTAAAATVPNLQIKCPAGNICGAKLEAPLCCAGATWYSGVDAGFLLTTSAPALTLTAASLR